MPRRLGHGRIPSHQRRSQQPRIQLPNNPVFNYDAAQTNGDGKQKFVAVTNGLSNTVLFVERFMKVNGPSASNLTLSCWAFGPTLGANVSAYPTNYSYWGAHYNVWSTYFAHSLNGLPQSGVPTPQQANYSLAQTGHPAGMGVGMLDGSVRVVTSSVFQSTWQRVNNPSNDLTIPNDW